MPLVRRVPKRGFTNIFRTEYAVINVESLNSFEEDVTPDVLVEKGLVRKGWPVKVLGRGEISQAVTVFAHKFSRSAREKIEAAGGRCEVVES
jgi:large subunit ribosomal protein L15